MATPEANPQNNALLMAFNAFYELLRATDRFSASAVEFRQKVSVDEVSLFTHKLKKLRGKDKVLSFRAGQTVAQIAAGIEAIIVMHNSGKRSKVSTTAAPKHMLEVAAAVIVHPPKSINHLKQSSVTKTEYLWSALQDKTDYIEWATDTGEQQPDYPMYWLNGGAPRYKDRRIHLYQLLASTYIDQVVKLKVLPQASDLEFFSYSNNGKTLSKSTISKTASAAKVVFDIIDTATTQPNPKRSIILRNINEQKHDNVTGTCDANGVYVAIMPVIDALDSIPIQFYVGKATNGTFNRWCRDSDCHLDKIHEIIKLVKAGAACPKKSMLVDMQLAALWIIHPTKWADVSVITVRIATPDTLKAVEGALIEGAGSFDSKDQHFGMNNTK